VAKTAARLPFAHPPGTSPGYVVDHIKALKHGGADDPSNMQWQTEKDLSRKW
jgi:hypothetical protein